MKQIVGALIVACTGATSASAATLTLTLGGTFYEGAPAYQIVADGQVVANGTVASERDDVVQVEVGDPASLAVRFTNDFAARLGADGKRPPGTDRNLIIQAVDFKGQTTLGRELFRPRGVNRLHDFAIVSTNQTVEIPIHLPAPATPTPLVLVATPTPAPVVVLSASFQTIGTPEPNATILMLPATEPISFTSVAPPTALAATP